ncbi:MAG: hypothetical protein AB7T63_02850 [Planctomycetota bacterium]
MTNAKTWGALLTALALAVVPACGGGGSGFSASTPSLTLGSALLPLLNSGEALSGDGYALPIEGGCGGPYTIRLIGGSLPDGIEIDDRQMDIDGPGNPAEDRHHLVGTALEDGVFSFRLEILDRGCKPSASMTADFTWSVTQGSVVIVDANPASIPVGLYDDPQKYLDVDALDKTVYGDFTSITFVIAGGVGPYTCAIIDDPADPDDDNGLPFGVVMPPASCSIVGSPQQVGDGGKPFRFTVLATDSVGNDAVRKFQWKIDTPPMIVGSTDIQDGLVGDLYGDAIQIVDGVPPFKFEMTADLPTDLDNTSAAWVYAPPAAPTFPSLSGFTVAATGEASNKLSAADYPAPAALGPYYPAPPEGLFITEDGGLAGSLSGYPRRYGSFTVNIHAYSATVPNERGQHAFAQFDFDVAPGAPMQMVDTFVVDGDGSNTFLANTKDGVATLPEFEVLQPTTVQMVATGGAPFDGYTDAPHASQRLLDLGEVAGTYEWSVSDWDPRGIGWHPGNVPAGRPTGIDADITGKIATTNSGLDLQRQGRQVIEVTVADQRLPVPGNDVHEIALSIGPDVLIIAESRQTSTTTTGGSTDSTPHGDSMFIKKMQIVNNVAQRSPLDDSDMAPTHIVPAIANLNALSNPLGRLISGVGKSTYTGTGRHAGASDLIRVHVNKTGWWNDSWQLHPKAARSFMHGDATKPYYEYYANEYYNYSSCAETTAVALPDIVDGSVAHDPSAGVYTDGGKLHFFENDTHFGVFIIRDDARIYVPFAMQKGTWQGFGDYCQSPLNGTGAGASSSSHMRIAHMGVSPNGRFAAFKIKGSPTSMYESTGTSRTVLIDLAGDKSLGGNTYRIVGTSYSSGYLMADAITLTDEHLYLLVQRGSLNNRFGWQQHNVYRESILGGTGTAQFAPGLPSNGTSSYLSLPYHNITTSYYSSSFNGSTVYYNYYFYMGGCSTNRTENDSAPIPFRVSADGSSCLLAAGAYTGATSGSTVHEFYAWVDKNGQGFRVASTTDRKMPYGGTTAHMLRWGAAYYGYAGHQQWGKYEGPSGNLEISDDGNRIAYGFSEVGSHSLGSYYSSYQTYYYSSWNTTRMNVMSATTGNDWASFSETAITAPYFTGSHVWRFGGLAFSRDGDRLFFFGGKSQTEAMGTSDYGYWTTSVRRASAWVTGTYYMYDFANGSQVRSLFPANAGGSGSNTYTAAQPFNPTTASRSSAWGVIKPFGGFWSKNGEFLYICSDHPLTASDRTAFRLVGINTTTATVNGHGATTGFAVANWPSNFGFLTGNTNISGYYGGMLTYIGPYGVQSLARIKMAEGTGVVFFGSHSQRYNYNVSTSYGNVYTLGYTSNYAMNQGHIECFAADVGGPIQRLTPFSNDGSLTSARGRNLQYIEVNEAGDRLIFHWNNGNSGGTSEYRNYLNHEGVGYIANIALDESSGALLSSTFTMLEGTTGSQTGQIGTSRGRAGGSVAFGTDGQRIYYSFGPNASNENARTIIAPRIDGDGNVDGSTTTRYGTGSRDAVLHASR